MQEQKPGGGHLHLLLHLQKQNLIANATELLTIYGMLGGDPIFSRYAKTRLKKLDHHCITAPEFLLFQPNTDLWRSSITGWSKSNGMIVRVIDIEGGGLLFSHLKAACRALETEHLRVNVLSHSYFVCH